MAASLPIPPRGDLFQEVFHGSSDGLAITRLHTGAVIEANDSFIRLVARPRQDVVGNTLANLRLWESADEERRFGQVLLEQGRVDIFDTELRLPGGQSRFVVLSAEILRNGREPMMFLRVGDREHRMRTAPRYRQLREADRLYRNLVETIPAVVYVDHPDDLATNIYTSPQTIEMFGYTPEDWASDPEFWPKRIHEADRERVMEANGRHQDVGSVFDEVYRFIRADGRAVWVRDVAVIVPDDDGKAVYSLGFLFDVSDLKETEARLQETVAREQATSEQLRELDQLKNTVLHTLSHDLKSPLAAILAGATTLARPDLELDEAERREMLRGMATRARKIDGLLANLLDLDRLQRGIVEPVRGPVEVHALLANLIEHLDDEERARIALNAEPLTAIVDAAKVERIADNLVSNALRHAHEGGPIDVRLRREDGGLLLSVEDRGPGVPLGLEERLFQAFERGPGTDGVPGTGIGLSLVARFAELHGGRAWVEPRPGGGASFHVLLREGERTY